MKIEYLKKDFIQINAEKLFLNEIHLETIRNNKATLIRNCSPYSENDYVQFSQRFGKILPYNNSPFFSFNGEAIDEVELHYDGISSSNLNKVPNWLIFQVQKAAPMQSGGAFRVADTENALKLLSRQTYHFLKTAKLQFFNYLNKEQDHNKISFEIDTILKIDHRESLRIFLPSQGERLLADSKKIFARTTQSETDEIFEELRDVLYSPSIIQNFTLQDNDILILNNNFIFHGRERFHRPVDRILNRIQALPESGHEFGSYF